MSIIATVEQLDAIYGQPNGASTVTVSAKITPPYCALIDKSPFAVVIVMTVDEIYFQCARAVLGMIRIASRVGGLSGA